MSAARAPVLVLGIGNPSRGDDALGPLALEHLAAALGPAIAAGELGAEEVELLTDFQLQIEHALDVAGRARVVFVDASVRAAPPFTLTRTAAYRDRTHTTHAMSPAAVLDAVGALGPAGGGPPGEAWTLAIRGDSFELGEPLSAAAAAHLAAALPALVAAVRAPRGRTRQITVP